MEIEIMSAIWKAFVRLQNLMRWLLRSPLHRIISSMYMLISVTGRKTGKVYTTPVQYKQQGQELWVITSVDYQWWRNLHGGARVQLLLRGVSCTATAKVSTDQGQICEGLRLLYPSMSPAQTQDFAGRTVLIRLMLH
jgi:deazaflavin-dependent oxidoreductase (nitroreductase family)